MKVAEDFLNKDGKWGCTQCAACCKFMSPLADANKFPKRWIEEDGSCRKLKRNKCRIFAKRPSICHTDKKLTDYQLGEMCAKLWNYVYDRSV